TIDTGDGNDQVTLALLTVDGAATVKTGNLDDILKVDDSIFNGLVTVDAGAGNDHLQIETANTGAATTFATSVTVTLGTGDDLVDLGIDVTNVATFNGAVKVDGGAGLDILNVLSASFSSPPALVGVEVGP